MKILNACGARPNFMKIAPLMAAYRKHPGIEPVLVHTGQHYDDNMSRLFFDQLRIPRPDISLGVGSGSHAVQTARIMQAVEPVVLQEKPSLLLVVGDVNSTLACALVAAKLGIPVAHVEAGLRSFDRSMPEEINRLLTDALADFCLCTQQSDVDNLRREGVPEERIFLVGNVMVDTLLRNRAAAEASPVLEDLAISPGGYAVLTLHRAGNVDDAACLAELLRALEVVQADMPVIFPVHPRTRKNLESSGMMARTEAMPGLRLVEPLGYLDFLKLMALARLVLTDSGGIQTETCILGVPCLTLRDTTEWPITIEAGTNHLVGTQADTIIAAYREVTRGVVETPQAPPLWDGHAANRIAEVIAGAFGV